MAVMSMLLPFELISMIVDYFQMDTTELAKCTLIARNWVLPSRYLLFRTLTIRQSKDIDGVAAFRVFLESARGQASANYTQGLCLRGVPPEDEEFWEPTLDLYELGVVVQQLTRLSVVNLDRVRFSGLPSIGPAPYTSDTVEILTFARMTTWTFDDLKDCIDVLHLFPGLKSMRTTDLTRIVKETGREYTLPPPSDYRPFSPKFQLEDLIHKAFGPCSPLFNYAAQAFNLCNLTSLTLWHLLPEEVASFGQFLVAVKGTLRYLYFSLADCLIFEDEAERTPGPQDIWASFKISECEVLETLVMFVALDHDPERRGPPFSYHPHWLSVEIILGRLPLSIRYLEFALEVGGDSDIPWFREIFRDVDWEDVSQSLDRLPELKTVKMHADYRWEEGYGYPLNSWTQKFLRRKLSDLNKKGVLDLTP